MSFAAGSFDRLRTGPSTGSGHTSVNTTHADDSVDATVDAADERALDDDPVGNERPGASEPARGAISDQSSGQIGWSSGANTSNVFL